MEEKHGVANERVIGFLRVVNVELVVFSRLLIHFKRCSRVRSQQIPRCHHRHRRRRCVISGIDDEFSAALYNAAVIEELFGRWLPFSVRLGNRQYSDDEYNAVPSRYYSRLAAVGETELSEKTRVAIDGNCPCGLLHAVCLASDVNRETSLPAADFIFLERSGADLTPGPVSALGTSALAAVGRTTTGISGWMMTSQGRMHAAVGIFSAATQPDGWWRKVFTSAE